MYFLNVHNFPKMQFVAVTYSNPHERNQDFLQYFDQVCLGQSFPILP